MESDKSSFGALFSSRDVTRSVFQDVNRKSTTVVESWEGTKTRQSYTHVMAKNASVSYTWAFQRTNQPSNVSTRSFILPTAL